MLTLKCLDKNGKRAGNHKWDLSEKRTHEHGAQALKNLQFTHHIINGQNPCLEGRFYCSYKNSCVEPDTNLSCLIEYCKHFTLDKSDNWEKLCQGRDGYETKACCTE